MKKINSSLSEQQKFMKMAIAEAKQARILDEVPIGAIVVHEGQVIGRGHNMREKFQDVTAEKCAQELDLILFQAIAGTGLPSVDWYFNYFNGNYFDKRELAHMIATEY